MQLEILLVGTLVIFMMSPLPLVRSLVYVKAFGKGSQLSAHSEEFAARFSNIARLYGGSSMLTQSLDRLNEASVCVIGLGGVGSWVVEALARSGISKLTLIDLDDICVSNTNRQLPALTSSIGKMKAEYLRDRVLDINPSAQVEVILDFVRPDNADAMLTTAAATTTGSGGGRKRKFDFVVDAADGVADKAAIIEACVRSSTPVIVSGGVGGLTDPTLIKTTDLAFVSGDNLLMRVRKRLRQKSGYPKGEQMSGGRRSKMKKWGIRCVHTLPTGESRKRSGDDTSSSSKCDAFGNSCFSTGTVGFVMASEVVNGIMKGSTEPSTFLPGDTPSPPPQKTLGSIATDDPVESNGSTGGSGDTADGIAVNTAGTPHTDAGAEDGGGLQGLALFDAHCHLNLSPLYEGAESAVDHAIENGVQFATTCATCPGEDWERVHRLYESYPEFILPQYGLHPWWLKRYAETQIAAFKAGETCIECNNMDEFDPYSLLKAELTSILSSNDKAGVGESGLDKNISKDVPMETQKKVANVHVEAAAEMRRPITFHCVGAWGALLDVLNTHRDNLPPSIIIHSSNSMPPEMLVPFMRIPNTYLSFSGGKSLTRPNTMKLLRELPLEKLLIETDSPNKDTEEMASLRKIIANVAQVKGMDPVMVAEAATRNAKHCFVL
jgi:tRNA A37 threonylcarbamoyladenosine dehydratase/Tat protein secretion system quality control protein TatD with DNase activity